MLKIEHEAGFFSCCSIRLQSIINYHNEHKRCPNIVDTKNMFTWYKNENNKDNDITFEYFKHYNADGMYKSIEYKSHNYYYEGLQFSNYKNLNFDGILPFIKKYFSPSLDITYYVIEITKKYKINFNNTAVLFYRGNDKATETKLSSYEEYIIQAHKILKEKPDIRFIIQSDETEFIEKMLNEFPSSIWFKDETRSIKRDSTSTVDFRLNSNNNMFSKYFLAIIIIMSKCRYIVCGSGNCSIWMAFYRGNANGMIQYFNGEWL